MQQHSPGRAETVRIASRDNPKVKEVVRLMRDGAARRAHGLMVCEGPVLLAEALKSGLVPQAVFALAPQAARLPEALWGRCPVYTVTPAVMAKLSDTESPQGLVFTLPIPKPAPPAGGPILALDGLADPGNLGTILRTADALGASVAVVGGGADPTAPKVVRAAMGSLFRVFPWACDYAGLAGLCRALGLALYAAALDEKAADARTLALGRACVLIGNEARGVSPEGLAICERTMIIPMAGAQSLNAAVAAAILLWEAVR